MLYLPLGRRMEAAVKSERQAGQAGVGELVGPGVEVAAGVLLGVGVRVGEGLGVGVGLLVGVEVGVRVGVADEGRRFI